MLLNEVLKEKNPECRECRDPVFILDFTNFAGFRRCDEIRAAWSHGEKMGHLAG